MYEELESLHNQGVHVQVLRLEQILLVTIVTPEWHSPAKHTVFHKNRSVESANTTIVRLCLHFVSVFLVGTGCGRSAGLRELFTLAKGKEISHSQGIGGLVSFRAKL
jgi:hypothetical protein